MKLVKRSEAMDRLHEITAGIDQDEGGSKDGWWENSTGVEYGSERLRLLEELVIDLTEEFPN